MDTQTLKEMELDKLSDHIISTHHVFVREITPQILESCKKIAAVHGNEHPEADEIKTTFETLSSALEEHMAGEEKYLFPYVNKLLTAKHEGRKLPKPRFGSIDKPLQHHYEDHDNAWNLMKKIETLANNYQLPPDADEAYQKLYGQLANFEKDLQQHIYAENEILFGKSIELEKEVVG